MKLKALYQIKGKATLIKHKGNRDIKFAPVYFNPFTKTVITFK